MSDRPPARLALILLLLAAAPFCIAQQPPAREEQEPVKVYSEEVRLPVVAYDDRERFDPTLAADDVLVLEDGVPQRVRSVRRVPASVLFVFDMGGQVTATGAVNATREAALRFLGRLGEGDRVAFVQNVGRRVEVLQDWTEDRDLARYVLRWKLFSANRSRLSECLTLAAAKLGERPVGNTHVVVFTDGLEAQSRNEIRADDIPKEVVQNLVAAQASVHVFGFSSLVGEVLNYKKSIFGGGVIDLDFQMRRWFKNYGLATKRREGQLHALAREVGGRVLLPSTPDEVPALAEKVARDVGAQYVVTYTPLRPFAEGGTGERRRAEVSARRMGLQLFTLRSVVTAPRRATQDER
ncbi:MAG: VWA domain-containing protein [Pyrinomonadaceae bacterium]